MQKRTSLIIACALVAVAAVIVFAAVQRAQKTHELLQDLYSGEPSKVVDAEGDLRKRGHGLEQALIAHAHAPAVDVRLAAAELLGDPRIGRPDTSGPALLQLLRDGDVGVRRKAAAALGRLGVATAESMQALLDRVTDEEEDLKVRIVATRALGALHRSEHVRGPEGGFSEVVSALVKILEERPPVPPKEEEEAPAKEETEAQAEEAQEKAETPAEAEEEPVEPEPADTTALLRGEIALTLGRISTHEAANAVIRSIDDEVEISADVREDACIALGDLNQTQTLLADAPMAQAAAEALLGALDDDAPNVRLHAAAALGRITSFSVPRNVDAATAQKLRDLDRDINEKIKTLALARTEDKGDPEYWVRKACQETAKLRGVRVKQEGKGV